MAAAIHDTTSPRRSRVTARTVMRAVAAEHRPTYDARATEEVAISEGSATSEVLSRLATAVDAVADVDLDPCADTELERFAAGLQRQLDRLTSRRDLLAGALRRRAVVRAGPGREERAVREETRRLADTLRLTPSEAKRASEAGRALTDRPELAAATDAGRLRPDQVSLIDRLLRDAPPQFHDQLRDELSDAARRLDAVQLGRLGRRRLAEFDQQAAVDAEQRRHARRRASVTQTPEGTVELHAALSGVDAEVACTAIDAFRTPDRPGGPGRTAEQRTADALVAALRASLDLGVATSNHRVRPHVLVTVDADRLGNDTGTAELPWTGPQPTRTVRRLAGDATLQLLGLDRVGQPLWLSRATEQPTAALYLALAVRDGGCRHPGCDAPAPWCDVAHATARRHDGEVTIDNTLLLCRRHHRILDLGHWTITLDGAQATFTHPNGRTVTARPPVTGPHDDVRDRGPDDEPDGRAPPDVGRAPPDPPDSS